MSGWITIEWNQKTISVWEKYREKGKQSYIMKYGGLLFSPFYFAVMMFYFYQNYKLQWAEDGGFWTTAALLFIGAIAFGYYLASWKWDETESSYQKYLQDKANKSVTD